MLWVPWVGLVTIKMGTIGEARGVGAIKAGSTPCCWFWYLGLVPRVGARGGAMGLVFVPRVGALCCWYLKNMVAIKAGAVSLRG